MSADQIEFRNKAERDRWRRMYERALDQRMDPHLAAAYANSDMEICRRVWPPPGEFDYAELLEVARSALSFKRNALPKDAGAIADIDEQIARIDRARGVQS